ncbi:peptidase U32 family protein [Undibacterium oligocarboniphilum]|uniref:U32 family peptidase n=2 Tax=Pseudomonadota TaxID=1224 RepID=A0A850QKU0_9BURK|nr:U32 family peptidase [Undibacterium oligocarboniphilum]MBC3869737.1 U32 family peptidase [Undibacterium oligocarboniphilum]NVO77340.1 U32 family peptidase [Undibacterium oligocarboniphilum]
MSLLPRQIELLSPAKNIAIGKEAILHGADAVYIGGPSFGARHNASNEISEIAELVQFAHRYHARIFVTMNTILHESELEPARRQISQLYEAGVDALIVQDMGILELDIPPIQLHASTQCDIRTIEKARFLDGVGFSQLVLARELTIEQIRAIKAEVRTPLEYFVHGALCVAFSGQCYISHADNGRSANRGDCSQACRLPYTLTDDEGRVVAYEKHLLSMKDNDQSRNLEALLDAGVQSLKIEGRYKDMGYVKNITAHYRLLLDEILEKRPEFTRASSGQSQIAFNPDVDKNFHRGHTDYFANGRLDNIGAFDSPKYVGLHLGYISRIGTNWLELETTEAMANGDGLNYMHKREVIGIQANTAERTGSNEHGEIWRIVPNEKITDLPGLKPGMPLNRNRDQRWEQALTKKSAERRIPLWMTLTDTEQGLRLSLMDEDGVQSQVSMDLPLEAAQQAEKAGAALHDSLAKLGGTMFRAEQITLQLKQAWFVPASVINALRRDAVTAHEAARIAAWQRPARTPAVEPPVPYPETTLSYLANVYNSKARAFYHKHGVQLIAAAYEAHEEAGEVPLMITKHCLRFSFNLCPKQAKGVKGVQGQVRADPMTLVSGSETYTLKFDCKPCEMHIIGAMKKHILQSPPPSSVPYSPLVFHKTRPTMQ